MEFVVNEWLPEYLIPTATDEEMEKVNRFLQAFLNRGDMLVVRNPSAFLGKVHRFRKKYDYDNEAREKLKYLIAQILENADICKLVDEEEIELPEPTNTLLLEEGTNYNSDRYLFEAATAIEAEDKIIVTTDVKLKEQMEDDPNFKVILLDDFLEDYS